jgi:hypothetical protein
MKLFPSLNKTLSLTSLVDIGLRSKQVDLGSLCARLLKSGFYLESLGGFRESNRKIES